MNIACRHRRRSYAAWCQKIPVRRLQCSPRAFSCATIPLRKSPPREDRVGRKRTAQSPEFREHGVWLEVYGNPHTETSEARSAAAKTADEGVQVEQRGNSPPRVDSRNPARSTKRKWSPYTLQGRDSLDALVASLRRLTVKTTDEQARVDELAVPFEPIRRISELLPESPVVRRLQQARQHKLRPDKAAEDPLAHNPWAQMLASPLRMCSATGMRLPRDLLTPWALTQNPIDQQIYLMPSELANLERLRQGVPEKIVMGGVHEVEDDLADGEEVSGKPTEAGVPVQRGSGTKAAVPRHLPKLYLLAMSDLLQHLTTQLMVPHTSPPRSHRGAVGRMLSYRLRTALEGANRHAKAVPDFTVKSTQLSPEPSTIIRVKDLEWRHDIQHRMHTILQERVLAAFEGFLNRNASSRNRKRIKIFSPPGLLELERRPERSDKLPFTPFYLEAEPSSEHHQIDEDTLLTRLSGSIFLSLHPGPPATAPSGSSRQVSRHPLLPPMINVHKTLPIPVFDLVRLLGPAGRDRIARLIQTRDLLEQLKDTDTSDDTEPDKTKLMNSTILIPSHAPTARTLVNEVWRLWRYIGGAKYSTLIETSMATGLEAVMEEGDADQDSSSHGPSESEGEAEQAEDKGKTGHPPSYPP